MTTTTSLFIFWCLLLGHLFSAYGQVDKVGRMHYWTHAIYALLEPVVIRVNDFMLSSPFFSRNLVGRKILWLVARTNVLLPHGVVIPTGAAIRILRDIEKYSQGQAHVAVGPCVCQRILNRYCEPTMKDMTVWYGAEIYKRFYDDEYRFISAEEGTQMLKEFHHQGLTPVAGFLMQSRKWMFVICNCDTEVCCLTRTHNIVNRSLYPGPFVALQDPERCKGVKECGACLERCHFSANREEDGKAVLDREKCLGCGLCVTTCQGQSRRLERRPGYRGRLLPWEYIKDAEIDQVGE